MANSRATQLPNKIDQALINLLWDYMKHDPKHSDRRQTAWGTKTRIGLAACINRIVLDTDWEQQRDDGSKENERRSNDNQSQSY